MWLAAAVGLAAPHAHAEAAPLTAAWDAAQAHLVVTWQAEGCVWLVGGPARDRWVEGACGAQGVIALAAAAGGDEADQVLRHAALELRSQRTGLVVARVAVPPRVWTIRLPIAARSP
jgi:hypothetical protein